MILQVNTYLVDKSSSDFNLNDRELAIMMDGMNMRKSRPSLLRHRCRIWTSYACLTPKSLKRMDLAQPSFFVDALDASQLVCLSTDHPLDFQLYDLGQRR